MSYFKDFFLELADDSLSGESITYLTMGYFFVLREEEKEVLYVWEI